jgi:hydroxyethylthiazole kinase
MRGGVSNVVDGKSIAAIMKEVRRARPLVHHLTNYVTMADCAAVTVSVGALPVMAQAEEEVEEMVAAAHAAVINTGTLSPGRARAMGLMGVKAREKGIPVILDPVGAGATVYRTGEILSLLREITPPIIKGNRAEIAFLAGMAGVKIRGIEALSSSKDWDPLEGAKRLRDTLGFAAVVVVTGPVDVVYDGKRTARVYNGHPLLPLVVGSGCMAASVTAAFAAVEPDYFVAATSALAALGVAAEMAAKTVDNKLLGPAAFKNQWLDTLYFLAEEDLNGKIHIE